MAVYKQGQIRALALRVLAEFLRCHSDRFGQYIEATIVKTLEAHRDDVKEVKLFMFISRLFLAWLLFMHASMDWCHGIAVTHCF